MTTPDAGPAASALDEIRANANGAITDSGEDCTDVRVSCLGHNTLRAAAALEAVLKLHQPVTTNGGWLEGREWQECGECGPNNGQENVYAMPGAGEEFWPCPTVRAITAALAGKEAGDGG